MAHAHEEDGMEYKEGDKVWVPATVADVYKERVYVKLFEHDNTTIGYDKPILRADGAAPEQGRDAKWLREAATFAVDAMMHPECYTSQAIKYTAACLQDALAKTSEPVGTPVTREEALRISHRISERAESRRREAVDAEAARAWDGTGWEGVMEGLMDACDMALELLDSPDDLVCSEREDVIDALRVAVDTARETSAEAAAPEPPIEGPVRVGDRVRLEGVIEEMNSNNTFCRVRIPNRLRWEAVDGLTIVSRPAPAETCGRCRWFRADAWVDKCRHDLGLDMPAADTPVCSHFELWEPRP